MAKDLTPEEKDKQASLIAEGKLVPSEEKRADSSDSATWVWTAVGIIVLLAIAGGALLGFLGGQFYGLFQPDERRAEQLIGASINEQGGGVMLQNVVPGGPADNAGISSGDQLLAIGSDNARSKSRALRLINQYNDGDLVLVTVQHNFRTLQLSVLMGVYMEIEPTVIILPPTPFPPETPIPQLHQGQSSARLGIRYRMLQPGDPFAVEEGALIVTMLADDAPAVVGGLQTGDIITHVGRTAINSSRPLGDVLADFSSDQRVLITANRGGDTVTVSVVMGGS